MGYRTVADLAVVLHFGFLVFLVVGGVVALRWRRVLWVHVGAVAWSLGILTVGQTCPLTALEQWANRRAGGAPYDGGSFHGCSGTRARRWLSAHLAGCGASG